MNVINKCYGNIEHFFNYLTHLWEKVSYLTLPISLSKDTEVVLHGEVKGTIEGCDFLEVFTSNWLGSFPPGQRFKEELLWELIYKTLWKDNYETEIGQASPYYLFII